MILVTGAAGKTGQNVIRTLAAHKQEISALVRTPEQIELVKDLGATKVISGDMRDKMTLSAVFTGAHAVYHIAPNMCPDELTIGSAVIEAAKRAGVKHFVYHSVLHPQVEDMPHHWLKMRVEEALFKSGLEYTILQPAAYMQNLLGYRDAVRKRGVYAVPYSVDSHQSMLDLDDLAEAAALVLTEPGHSSATYELVSPDAPSPREIASLLSERTGKPVRAEEIDRTAWEAQSRANGMNEYAVNTLLKMFVYYDRHNFYGNPHVLHCLLGREPSRLTHFVDRNFTP